MLAWSAFAAPAMTAADAHIELAGSAPVFVAGSPGNTDTNVTPGSGLTWSFTGASSYDLYFGTTTPPPIISTGISVTSASPAEAANTTYYWQVDATNASGTTSTGVMTFTTGAAPPSSSSNSSGCALIPGSSVGANFAQAWTLAPLALVVVVGLTLRMRGRWNRARA